MLTNYKQNSKALSPRPLVNAPKAKTQKCSKCLTLSGTGQGIFIPLSLLDQIFSAEFFSKILTLLKVKIEINRVILTPYPAH
jgi:hypothetical protein